MNEKNDRPVVGDTISDTVPSEKKPAPKRNRHAKAAPVVTPQPHPGTRTDESIQKRINELIAEFEAGQKMMIELQNKRAELEQTMLRISGAIQILRELLPAKPADGANE